MQKKMIARPLALLAGLLLLSGCADWERHAQQSLPAPTSPYETKQIVVAPTRSVFALNFAPGKVRLSDDEQVYLADFLSRTVQDSERTVMVEQPARGADRLARQRAKNVADALKSAGYHIHPLTGMEPVSGQVHIAVDHLLAQAPNCPDWDIHPNHAFSAEALPNHGCADRSNLAAMVENPRDLVIGRTASAPMGHAALIGEVKYRRGQIEPLQDAGDIVGQ